MAKEKSMSYLDRTAKAVLDQLAIPSTGKRMGLVKSELGRIAAAQDAARDAKGGSLGNLSVGKVGSKTGLASVRLPSVAGKLEGSPTLSLIRLAVGLAKLQEEFGGTVVVDECSLVRAFIERTEEEPKKGEASDE